MTTVLFIKTFMMMGMSASFIFMILSKHPLVLGFLVILQSVFMSSMITIMFSISWFSFLIFIIYLGGILMLFSYMISIMNSSENLFTKSKKYIILMMILFLWGKKEESFFKVSKINVKELLISMYSMSMNTSVFMMIFLLMIMIFVVMISESSKGLMRSI